MFCRRWPAGGGKCFEPAVIERGYFGIKHSSLFILYLVEIPAWGANEFEINPGGPDVLGHEVDDALFHLEGAGDAEQGGGLGEDPKPRARCAPVAGPAPFVSPFPKGCRSRSARTRLTDDGEHPQISPRASPVCRLARSQ